MTARRRALAALSCALSAAAVLCAAAAAGADVSGPAIVGFLNAQRAAHNLPAGIVEDPELSQGCARHNVYGQLNGLLTHHEDPARPGYTPEGAQAGRTSVLYRSGAPWSAGSNPFETAPLHLHQLLAPRLDRMGASELQGHGCATTLASRSRPAPASDVTYTYPGQGATSWPTAQVAAESPYTPGERVGIPAGTRTGPYLYVSFDGPDLGVGDTAAASSASLRGPDGEVEVAVVDNHTPGLEGYLPTGMEVIPRAPLRPYATYTASIAARVPSSGGRPSRVFRHRWSFTTGPIANAVIASFGWGGRQVRVSARSDAPGATVIATGPGTSVSRPLGADGRATLDLDAGGTWTVCVRSGGGATGFRAAEDCRVLDLESDPPPWPSPPVDPVTGEGPTGNPARTAGPPVGPVQPAPGAGPSRAPTPSGDGTPPEDARDGPVAPVPAAARRFTVVVPRTVRRGRSIPVTGTSPVPFSARLAVTARFGPRRRSLVRRPARRFAAGRWAWEVRVPRRHVRPGRRALLTVTATLDGRRVVERRRIRFR